MNKYKKYIESTLYQAGIQLNGDAPWDIKILNNQFYEYVSQKPALRLGEAYVAGWWDCPALDQFFYKLLTVREIEENFRKNISFNMLLDFLFKKLKHYIINPQSIYRSLQVARKHYDLGNELFTMMLDKELNYSCGYWERSQTLETAQNEKLNLICKKLQLTAGMTVLDIGCGWGSFARFATKYYGVKVTGITISKQQYLLAKDLCHGLPIEIRLQDYRMIKEQYDCICSIGMFEHVGYKNYLNYMKKVVSCLKERGLFLLHTIGSNQSIYQCNDWINEYIFPNSMLPSIKQIGSACEKILVMEDWHNFGSDYDRTLLCWYDNFSQGWDKLHTQFPQYDEKFFRMWSFYLLSCAGAFRSRALQLWQIVFSKNGLENGYISIR